MNDPGLPTVAEGRSKIYWFLSHFYLIRPNGQFLGELSQWLAEQSRGGEEGLTCGVDLLKSVLRERDRSQLTERLLREYTRLFRGVKEGYGPPPPYESVYRESRLMGDITAAVVAKYAQAGYAVIDLATGPQDHIGAELKFMALLCYDESVAWRKGDTNGAVRRWQWQENFLDEHLLHWVPAYCDRIQENSVEPFYRAAALLTEQTVVQDRRLLRDLRQAFAATEPGGDAERRERC